CSTFLHRLLNPQESARFLGEAAALVDDIAAAGAVNAFTQTLLRMTTPGMPDLYQGCEFWDFSLVDPDNRRAVDFESRAAALDESLPDSALISNWRDGRIKQRLIQRVLALRGQTGALFTSGQYRPLPVRGAGADYLLAFAREWGDQVCIIVVP